MFRETLRENEILRQMENQRDIRVLELNKDLKRMKWLKNKIKKYKKEYLKLYNKD